MAASTAHGQKRRFVYIFLHCKKLHKNGCYILVIFPIVFFEFLDYYIQVQTAAGIQFMNGGFINYETESESVQDEVKNIVEIYFEK